MIPSLETERLLLRPFSDDDLDAYARYTADPEVMRYMGGTAGREDAWRQIAMLLGHWQLRGFGMWAMEEKRSGALVGRVGCHQPEGWPGFEIGWMLGREHWGQGFATEGARASMQYAFEMLEQPHVISVIHPQNIPSIRLAERLGEREEGKATLRGMDVLLFGIDRADWESSRER